MCLRFDVIDTVDFFLETKHGLIFRGSSLAACRKGGSQPERSSTSTPPYLAIVEREECRCSDLRTDSALPSQLIQKTEQVMAGARFC